MLLVCTCSDTNLELVRSLPLPLFLQCGVCGTAVTTRSHLAVHMRVHSKEKPFECAHCHKAFSDASAHRRDGWPER